MDAIFPAAELDAVAAALDGLPGVDGGTDRRRLLRLLRTTGPDDKPIPDHVIDRGWDQVVYYLAQPPAAAAVGRLRELLSGLRRTVAIGDAERLLAEVMSRVDALAEDRSFRAFLARIGMASDSPDSSGISVLDRVFVPPAQYPQAVELLEREHVLCLFGDPHMGKTYCALRLLWEYFAASGREPYWHHGIVSAGTRPDGQGPSRQDDFASMLRENSAVYIEDPFGRATPAENIEALIADTRRLILEAKVKDVRVIVTSRSAVFRTAVADRLDPYVVTLTQELLVGRSYDQPALERIADYYLRYYGPAWTGGADHGPIARQVAAELPAPHNIREFMSATKAESDAAVALRRLEAFRDIVQEFAAVIAKLDDWLLDALLVIIVANADLGEGELGNLYGKLNRGRPPYQSFEAAVRSLGEYLLAHASWDESRQLLLPRHPSIGEAVELLTRRSESRLEAAWLLIEYCHKNGGGDYSTVAIRLLATYADRWARIPGRLGLLADYFDSKSLDVRATSRRAIINRFDQLSADAAELVTGFARQSWGDRFLLMLIYQSSCLTDDRYIELALRLTRSGDDQTRFFLADWLGGPLRPVARGPVAGVLLGDPEGLVRRTAIVRLAQRGAPDEALAARLIPAALGLAPRHQRWIKAMLHGHDAGSPTAAALAEAVAASLAATG